MEASIAGLRDYVKVFRGIDYTQWRRRIENAFAFFDIINYTDEGCPQPELPECKLARSGETSLAEEHDMLQCQRQDRRAIALIEICLSEAVISAIPAEKRKTSKSYLDALEARYTPSSTDHPPLALPPAKKFADLKKSREEDMLAFLDRVNRLRREESAATGLELSDEQVREILTDRLPFDFFPILDKIIMSSKTKEHLTDWEKTQESLIRLDAVISSRKQRREPWQPCLLKQHPHESNLYIGAPGTKDDYREWKCSFCGRAGHTASRCFWNPEGINYRGSPATEGDDQKTTWRELNTSGPQGGRWRRDFAEIGENAPSTRNASPTLSSYHSST